MNGILDRAASQGDWPYFEDASAEGARIMGYPERKIPLSVRHPRDVLQGSALLGMLTGAVLGGGASMWMAHRKGHDVLRDVLPPVMGAYAGYALGKELGWRGMKRTRDKFSKKIWGQTPDSQDEWLKMINAYLDRRYAEAGA